MWLTFRQMRVSQRRATSGPGVKPDLGWRQKRFKWYALYSWGCPFVISMVTGEFVLSITEPGAHLFSEPCVLSMHVCACTLFFVSYLWGFHI